LEVSRTKFARAWSNNTGVGKDISGERIIRFGLKGSSDIIGIYKGLFLGIEVKTGSAKQSKDQKRFQNMIDKMGGIYVVITDKNVNQLLNILESEYARTN